VIRVEAEFNTERASPMNQMLWNYSYLQILDFLTTIAFLVNGVKEGNPLVRYALSMGPSPIGGLIAVKIAAVMLGIYCWRMGRQRLLGRINILFAIVIAWNLVALIVGSVGVKGL
jgi:hypothetical protein